VLLKVLIVALPLHGVPHCKLPLATKWKTRDGFAIHCGRGGLDENGARQAMDVPSTKATAVATTGRLII
jgi:hypothetical protein